MTFLVNDEVLKIIVRQTLFGQSIMNVFWGKFALNEGLSMDIGTFNDQWWLLMNGAWKNIVSQDLKFVEIETVLVQRFDEPFEIKTITEQGGIAVGSFPSQVTATFKLNVGSRLTRPGSKRISGIAEPEGEGNTWIAGFKTRANVFAGIIGQPMAIENDLGDVAGVFLPHVFQRPLPAFPNVYVGQPVTSCSLNDKVGSQNTRKP